MMLDGADFNTRLRRLRVPGELQVYRQLPHGFMNFPDLPDAGAAIDRLRNWIFAGLRR